MGILVEVRGVCKSYKHGNLNTEVLRHVDMSVLAGEMVSIVGPSGSGKSTLLHCLAGLEVPGCGRDSSYGRGCCASKARRAREG